MKDADNANEVEDEYSVVNAAANGWRDKKQASPPSNSTVTDGTNPHLSQKTATNITIQSKRPHALRYKKIHRGPYRRYTPVDKRKAISLSERLNDTAKAAHILGIPVKNLRRWIHMGPLRKRGGKLNRRP